MKTINTQLLVLTAAHLSIPALSQASVREHSLDIARQPIADELVDSSRQTGLKVVYLREALGGEWGQNKDDNGQAEKVEDARESDKKRLRGAVEEVIVTAQKRQERLQDVPISISVLGGETLESSSFSAVNDVLRTVPGIAAYEQSQGAGLSKFSIRGVGSNESLFNGAATLAYYLDEIPFAFVRFPVSPDVNAYDLERVEVLRGPQGSLYGASALNGVVRTVTHDADLNEVEFKTRATLSSTRGGDPSYRGDAALNVPVVADKLAVRAVAGYADNGGWIDAPALGMQDINDEKQKYGRFKINAAPLENFGVEFLAWISRNERGAASASADDGTIGNGNLIFDDLSADYDAYGLTLTYDLPSVSILSATSYMEFDTSSTLGQPISGIETGLITRLNGELISQEVRLNSRSKGPWKWSLGGLYREAEDSSWQDISGLIPAFTGTAENVYKSTSLAAFGELSRLFFGDKLEATVGLRYFYDESSSFEAGAFNPAATLFGKREENFDALTPRVVLSYKPGSQTAYYASYSQGFRSGFAQQGEVLRITSGLAPAVEPDRLHNYEVGTKGSTQDGRFAYDVAVYYVDWRDAVQVLETLLVTPGGSVGFFGAVNSEAINGFGVDFAATFSPLDRLEISATFGWNDLAFSSDVMSGRTVVFPEGSRPADSPELNAGGSVRYEIPMAGGYSLGFAAAATYTTRMLARITSTGAVVYGDNLVNTRASFSLNAPGGWSAMIFGDNLTNEYGAIRASVRDDFTDRFRPRTIGVQLEYRFN